MAEWARLLSECRGNSVAGSNPAFPATNKHTRFFGCVLFLVARPHSGDDIRIPPSPPRTNTLDFSGVFYFRSRVPIQGMIFESRLPRHEQTLSIFRVCFIFGRVSPLRG